MVENLTDASSMTNAQHTKTFFKRPLFLIILLILILLLAFYLIIRSNLLGVNSMLTNIFPNSVIFQNPLIKKIDSLIDLSKNPDKNLIKQYELRTGSIEANANLLIEGRKNPQPGEVTMKGLNDVKNLIANGNSHEAKQIIKDLANNHVIGRSFATNPSKSDLVNLTDEEIQRIDKDNNFARLKLKNRAGQVSVVWKNILIDLVNLFYEFK